jgi:hypothetical protein
MKHPVLLPPGVNTIAVDKYIDIPFIIYAGVYFGWAGVWVLNPE